MPVKRADSVVIIVEKSVEKIKNLFLILRVVNIITALCVHAYQRLIILNGIILYINISSLCLFLNITIFVT